MSKKNNIVKLERTSLDDIVVNSDITPSHTTAVPSRISPDADNIEQLIEYRENFKEIKGAITEAIKHAGEKLTYGFEADPENTEVVFEELNKLSINYDTIEKRFDLASNYKDFSNLTERSQGKKLDWLKEYIRIAKEEKEKIDSFSKQLSEQNHRYITDIKSIRNELENANKELEERTEALLKDPLTGLYTRTAYEFAGDDNREQLYNACLFIDINSMKYLNDDFGHDFVDAMLKTLGDTLNRNARKSDLLIRQGGDEIVYLADIKDEGDNGIRKISEKIYNSVFGELNYDIFCKNISHRLIEEGEHTSPAQVKYRFAISGFGLSVGGSYLDNDIGHIVPSSNMVKDADNKMYSAKREIKRTDIKQRPKYNAVISKYII